jgi:hypothetical protein
MKTKKYVFGIAAAMIATCVSCVVPFADLSSIEYLLPTPRRSEFPIGYAWDPNDPYDGVGVTAIDTHGNARELAGEDVTVTFPDYADSIAAFAMQGVKRVKVEYLDKSATFSLLVVDASGIGGGGNGGGSGGSTIVITTQ